jgi:hypothetical protein
MEEVPHSILHENDHRKVCEVMHVDSKDDSRVRADFFLKLVACVIDESHDVTKIKWRGKERRKKVRSVKND